MHDDTQVTAYLTKTWWEEVSCIRDYFRESCKPIFKKLKLLTLPSIYILQTLMFFFSKCALARGRDIHGFTTGSRESYQTGRDRTVVYEHLPSQGGVHLINKLPNYIKNAPLPQALKTRLKRSLMSWHFTASTNLLNLTQRPMKGWHLSCKGNTLAIVCCMNEFLVPSLLSLREHQ